MYQPSGAPERSRHTYLALLTALALALAGFVWSPQDDAAPVPGAPPPVLGGGQPTIQR